MSIRTEVVSILRERFPDRPFVFPDNAEDVIAVLPGELPELDPLEIHDDGDSISVSFGTFSHAHFFGSLKRRERGRGGPEELADFLQKLFADRILLWQGRIAGGITEIKREPRLRKAADSYVWSRVLRRRAG